MLNKSKTNEGMSEIKKDVLIGAGIASLVAGVAGTYFLYGSKSAPKNRKKIRGWALKAKGEVLEKLEFVSDMSEEMYHSIVKEISDKYKGLKNIDISEIEEFVAELIPYWGKIKNDVEKKVSGHKGAKAKTIKSANKKSSKK